MPRRTDETVITSNDKHDAEQAVKPNKKKPRRKTYAYIDDDGNIVESSDDEKNVGPDQMRMPSKQAVLKTTRKAPIDRSIAIKSRAPTRGRAPGTNTKAAPQVPDGSNSWVTVESRKKQRSSPTPKSPPPRSQRSQTVISSSIPSRTPSPIPTIALLVALPSPASRQNLRPDSTLRPSPDGPTYAAVVKPISQMQLIKSSNKTRSLPEPLTVAAPREPIVVKPAPVTIVAEPAAANIAAAPSTATIIPEPAHTADNQEASEAVAITVLQTLFSTVAQTSTLARVSGAAPAAVIANESTIIGKKRPAQRSDDDDSDAGTNSASGRDPSRRKRPRSSEVPLDQSTRNEVRQQQQPQPPPGQLDETAPRARVSTLSASKRTSLRDAANERSTTELSQRQHSATMARANISHRLPAPNSVRPAPRATATAVVGPEGTAKTATASGHRSGMTGNVALDIDMRRSIDRQVSAASPQRIELPHVVTKQRKQRAVDTEHSSKVVRSQAGPKAGGSVSKHRASGDGDGNVGAGVDVDVDVDVDAHADDADGDGDVGGRVRKDNCSMECFQYPKDGDDLQALLFADSQNESKNGGRHGHCYPGQRLCLLRREGEEQLVRFKNSVPKDFASLTERLSPKVLSQRRYALWNALAKGGQKISELSHSLTVVMHLDTARRKPELDVWANPWALYYMQDDIDTMARQMFLACNQITRNDPMHHTNVSVTSTLVRDAQLKYEQANRQLEQEQQEKRVMMAELEALRAQRQDRQ